MGHLPYILKIHTEYKIREINNQRKELKTSLLFILSTLSVLATICPLPTIASTASNFFNKARIASPQQKWFQHTNQIYGDDDINVHHLMKTTSSPPNPVPNPWLNNVMSSQMIFAQNCGVL